MFNPNLSSMAFSKLLAISVWNCGILATALAAELNTIHHITLPQRRLLTRTTGDVNGPALLTTLNETLMKYNATPLFLDQTSSERFRKRLSEESLTDQVDVSIDEEYYGHITVGRNEPQIFLMEFDTGSADIFVPGPTCGVSEGCPHKDKYYYEGGVNQHRTTLLSYGSGFVFGDEYTDDITVAGLTSTNQTLLSISSAIGFSDSNANGLLGMSFSTLSETGSATFFENLIAQKKITTPEFSFYLGRVASGTAQRSQLTLGGHDTSKFTGKVTTTPVTTRGFWQVAVNAVMVNGISAGPSTKGQAAIDTGTTLILAPTVAATAIFARIPGAFPVYLTNNTQPQLLHAYPCATPSTYIPAFNFAGTAFAIDARDFNLGVLTKEFAEQIGNASLAALLGDAKEKMCVGAIFGVDVQQGEVFYIVGDVLLKNWYSIFSYAGAGGGGPSVGLAKAV